METQVSERLEKLTVLRKHLHQYPELSQQEFETQEYLREVLSDLSGGSLQTIGGTGLLLTFEGKEAGKTILLRADIDALPIQEVNEMPWRSLRDGVSHKCGHDGHTAIMVGVAMALAERPPQKGRVLLLFQPAEENGAGANLVLQDPIWDEVQPDLAFALHNLPGFPLHQVVLREPYFTAAVKSVILDLKGAVSHAAEPEKGCNPALAIAEIIQMFDSLAQPLPEREDFALTTPVHINMGEKAYGISAGAGSVHYTLRTWDNEQMGTFVERIMDAAQAIATKHGLKLSSSFTQEFYANKNNAEAVKLIRESAVSCGLEVRDTEQAFRWGEDFGLFTERFPGALFGLGAGVDQPPLHREDYDFPDALIETGTDLFVKIIRNSLS